MTLHFKGLFTPSEGGSEREKDQRTSKKDKKQECIPVGCVALAC